MQPPRWAVEDSTRLSLDGFSTCFAQAWAGLESRFLKLESWQTYFEAEGNKSQAAFNQGDVSKARDLLRQEAESDRPLYEDIRLRGLSYARIRLVQEPLTPYLQYELINYRIRAAMGENIEIVRCAPETQLPNEQYFDFLLFDDRTALIHDYGEVGRQAGGWLTQDTDVIAALGATAHALRRVAIPLEQFVADG